MSDQLSQRVLIENDDISNANSMGNVKPHRHTAAWLVKAENTNELELHLIDIPMDRTARIPLQQVGKGPKMATTLSLSDMEFDLGLRACASNRHILAQLKVTNNGCSYQFEGRAWNEDDSPANSFLSMFVHSKINGRLALQKMGAIL